MAQLIRGLYQVLPKGSVVTIGNFDGVHIGHQALLKKTREKAQELQTTSLVITFEPQPYEFFAKEKAVPRLTRLREKFYWLAKNGVDAVLMLRFDAQFAAVSAEEFIQKILKEALQVKYIIVGDDFRFGQGRRGNIDLLKRSGIPVEIISDVMLADERISSTRVRKALVNADHTLVKKLLGRPYTMQGRVVHGDKRGRILGFPTANIFLHRPVAAVQGIYIVRMKIGEKNLPGVASIGIRPTVGGTKTLLEVHLFDFAEDIYGKQVSVEFCEKIRDEEKFASLELLTEKIREDVKIAKNYFNNIPSPPAFFAGGEG